MNALENLGWNLYVAAGCAMAYYDGFYDGVSQRDKVNRARWQAGEVWWGLW